MINGSYTEYDTQRIEDIYPYSIEVPDIITKLSREITKNSTLIVRLVKLMLDDGPPVSNPDYKFTRVAKRLDNQFKIWESHYEADHDEYKILKKELEQAIITRDSLITKRTLDDLNEQDYMLRLSVAEWNINELRTQKSVLESNLKSMEKMRVLQTSEDVDYLYKLSKDNYRLISGLEIQPETMGMLLNVLTKTLDTINNKKRTTI